jgi:hypothetical protein
VGRLEGGGDVRKIMQPLRPGAALDTDEEMSVDRSAAGEFHHRPVASKDEGVGVVGIVRAIEKAALVDADDRATLGMIACLLAGRWGEVHEVRHRDDGQVAPGTGGGAMAIGDDHLIDTRVSHRKVWKMERGGGGTEDLPTVFLPAVGEWCLAGGTLNGQGKRFSRILSGALGELRSGRGQVRGRNRERPCGDQARQEENGSEDQPAAADHGIGLGWHG